MERCEDLTLIQSEFENDLNIKVVYLSVRFLMHQESAQLVVKQRICGTNTKDCQSWKETQGHRVCDSLVQYKYHMIRTII